MKKFLVVAAAILSIMLMGIGSSQAATSVLENLPGGAGVGYWDCTGGTLTVMSVSNVTSQLCGDTAVVVHYTFYDRDSVKKADFPIPLSPRDTWAATLSCNLGTVSVVPALPQGGFLAAGDRGTATHLFGNANGETGYYTVTVSRVDDTQFGGAGICGVIFGGDGNGDPRNDPNWSNFDIVMPNMIYIRNAYVNLAAQAAWAMNGWMLQDFMNIGSLSEAAFGEFFDSVFDFWCPGATVDWNGDANLAQVYAGTDDGAGLNIDPWELYLTDNLFGSVVADLCTRGGRQRAFGAGYDASFVNPTNGIYWGRFNVTPGDTASSLVLVLPAATAELANSCANGANNINFLSYDDEEVPQTWTLCPREANPLTIGQGAGFDIAVNNPYGEMRIASNIPMMGFIQTTGPNYADTYPLVRENAAMYLQNFTFYPYIFGLSEIYYIGN